MSQTEGKKVETENFKLSKKGSWEDIRDACENICSKLKTLKPNDFDQEATEGELKELCDEWEEWRPHGSDDFSEEMREKTAKQSSVKEGKLEKEGKKAKKEVKEAGNSVVKATKKAKDEGLSEAKDHFVNAVEKTGKAVDSGVRKSLRKIEEQVYEKVILKANSLYFDNSMLGAVLSKKLGADSSERYELTLHSNDPYLRKLLGERIDWDVD